MHTVIEINDDTGESVHRNFHKRGDVQPISEVFYDTFSRKIRVRDFVEGFSNTYICTYYASDEKTISKAEMYVNGQLQQTIQGGNIYDASGKYVSPATFVQHNSTMSDDLCQLAINAM